MKKWKKLCYYLLCAYFMYNLSYAIGKAVARLINILLKYSLK